MARPEKIRLGDLLVQQKLISMDQLQFALEQQKRSGRKLGRVLVDNGFVSEEAYDGRYDNPVRTDGKTVDQVPSAKYRQPKTGDLVRRDVGQYVDHGEIPRQETEQNSILESP